MSKKKVQIRDYRFSDAKLKQLADGIMQNIDRDSASFNTKGFTAAKKQMMIDYINQFANLPVDEQVEGIQITKTEEKDASRIVVEKLIRTILVMAENKYGKASGNYRRFGAENLSRMSDEQIIRAARSVAQTGTDLLSDLKTEGLTQTLLDELIAKNIVLDNAIDKQLEATRNRDIATDTRITIGNKIYIELVKLCNTGKDIWYTENEAKYNDYIIYNTPSGESEPEPANSGSSEGEVVAGAAN